MQYFSSSYSISTGSYFVSFAGLVVDYHKKIVPRDYCPRDLGIVNTKPNHQITIDIID